MSEYLSILDDDCVHTPGAWCWGVVRRLGDDEVELVARGQAATEDIAEQTADAVLKLMEQPDA